MELSRYEEGLRAEGFSRLAGVDEAGRGAWAGPMVAAAVILPDDFDTEGIDDSKALSPARREEAFERIVAGADAVSVRRVTASGIDNRGLHKCNLALLREAVRSLPVEPDYVLSDGFPVPGLATPHLSIKKGDAVTVAIAAASIVAKVTRDRMMRRYDRRFPGFGFDRNKGYGTAEHREALDRLGPTPIHRLSFSGIGQVSLLPA